MNRPGNSIPAAINAYKTNRCLVKSKPDSIGVWLLEFSRTCQKLDNRILWSYTSEGKYKQGYPDNSYKVLPKLFHPDAFPRIATMTNLAFTHRSRTKNALQSVYLASTCKAIVKVGD
jgi:hypothetical protein